MLPRNNLQYALSAVANVCLSFSVQWRMCVKLWMCEWHLKSVSSPASALSPAASLRLPACPGLQPSARGAQETDTCGRDRLELRLMGTAKITSISQMRMMKRCFSGIFIFRCSAHSWIKTAPAVIKVATFEDTASRNWTGYRKTLDINKKSTKSGNKMCEDPRLQMFIVFVTAGRDVWNLLKVCSAKEKENLNIFMAVLKSSTNYFY